MKLASSILMCLIAATDAQWQRLFALLGQPELIHDPRFVDVAARGDNIDAAYGVVAAGLRTKTTAEWFALLATADLPHGPANTMEDLLADPYLREVGAFKRFTHETEGEITMIAPAVDFAETPLSITRGAPGRGAHTAEILREAGLDEAAIAALAR